MKKESECGCDIHDCCSVHQDQIEHRNTNILVRFLDDQTTETLKGIKEAALENQKSIDTLKKTLWEASEKITSLLKQL